VPGAVIAMQSFGDFLGFNPHTHILVTDGCFYGDGGMFRVSPPFELKKLEAIFRHTVFRMLLNKRKITQEMIAMLSTWRPASTSSAATVCLQMTIRPWKIWRATSFGRPSPKSVCSTWIRRGRLLIHPEHKYRFPMHGIY
jgi:hypothetical protein